MQIINRNETPFNLGAGQILKLPRMPRVNITCRAGEIWITEGGVGKDVILGYGSTYTSQGKGNVIAYAHEPSGLDASRIPGAIARWVEFARTIRKRLGTMRDLTRHARAGRGWLIDSQS